MAPHILRNVIPMKQANPHGCTLLCCACGYTLPSVCVVCTDNEIGPEGAGRLAEALLVNETLTTLGLSSMRFGIRQTSQPLYQGSMAMAEWPF